MTKRNAGELARDWFRAHLAKLLLSIVIAACFVFLLARGGLPLIPDRAAFARTTWWCGPVFLVLLSAASFLRTYRWHYMLSPLGERDLRATLGIGLVGYALIMFAPLRLGEVARPYLIARRQRVTFFQAASSIGAERVSDGLALAGMLLLGLLISTPLSPLPDHVGKLAIPAQAVHAAAYGTLLLFGGVSLGTIFFYKFRAVAKRLLFRVIGLVSHKAAHWITTRVSHLADGLSGFADRRYALLFMRETVAYSALGVLSTWVALRGCGIAATLGESLVVIGLMGMGSLIPSGPGFFGTYQLATYCALAMFYSEKTVLAEGAAFVFITYVCQVIVAFLAAFAGALLMRRSLPGALLEANAEAANSGRS